MDNDFNGLPNLFRFVEISPFCIDQYFNFVSARFRSFFDSYLSIATDKNFLTAGRYAICDLTGSLTTYFKRLFFLFHRCSIKSFRIGTIYDILTDPLISFCNTAREIVDLIAGFYIIDKDIEAYTFTVILYSCLLYTSPSPRDS